MQTRIDTGPVSGLALGGYRKSLIEETERTSFSLLLISYLQGFRQLEKRIQTSALADHKITKMRRQSRHEMKGVETLGQNLVKGHQSCRIVTLEEGIHKRETVLIIKYIKVAEHILILDVGAAECNSLVKDGKGITHRTVCLMGNDMKRLVVYADTFARSDHTEVPDNIVDGDPVEVIGLAT